MKYRVFVTTEFEITDASGPTNMLREGVERIAKGMRTSGASAYGYNVPAGRVAFRCKRLVSAYQIREVPEHDDL